MGMGIGGHSPQSAVTASYLDPWGSYGRGAYDVMSWSLGQVSLILGGARTHLIIYP